VSDIVERLRTEAADLRAENERLKMEVSVRGNMLEAERARVAELEAEVERLRRLWGNRDG